MTKTNNKTARILNSQGYGDKIADLVGKRYAVKTTAHVENTIDGDVSSDPIAKQYVPQLNELKVLPEELFDPIGDYEHTPVKGIVHRYGNRALFKPANICAVYCRFCFRREMVGHNADILTPQERLEALDYIRRTPSINEIILTGGDPLILSARQLGDIMSALDGIPHVKIIRLHTRIPIADPDRITDELLQALKTDTQVYIALHINHVQEITPDVTKALKALRDKGCTLLSQSVLLKDVNDDVETLKTLFETLVTIGVKPYYLHHADLAPGTSHFRTTIAHGQKLYEQLQGHLSGLAMPRYVIDIPGGYGKIPVSLPHVTPRKEGGYILTDRHGKTHIYAPQHELKTSEESIA